MYAQHGANYSDTVSLVKENSIQDNHSEWALQTVYTRHITTTKQAHKDPSIQYEQKTEQFSVPMCANLAAMRSKQLTNKQSLQSIKKDRLNRRPGERESKREELGAEQMTGNFPVA